MYVWLVTHRNVQGLFSFIFLYVACEKWLVGQWHIIAVTQNTDMGNAWYLKAKMNI